MVVIIFVVSQELKKIVISESQKLNLSQGAFCRLIISKYFQDNNVGWVSNGKKS